ncbi:MAG TPA: hypothetical protein VF803_02630 [Candidatus Paceibacterota bacterium]
MNTIQGLIGYALMLINSYIIPLLVALAILYFFWGIVQYIKESSAEGKKDGLAIMGKGIIGLVVMLSVWGIVALIGNSLGISGSATVTLPSVRTQ